LSASSPTLGNFGRFTSANGYTLTAGLAGSQLHVSLSYTGQPANAVVLSTSDEVVCTVTLTIIDPSQSTGLAWWPGTPKGFVSDLATGYPIENTFVGFDDSPLPVSLASFKVNATNGAATLVWTTASEINNYGFYVEKSADKQTWTSVTFISGHGTSLVAQTYTYTDAEPSIYYRLKQVDLNGDTHYSDIVALNLTAVETETPAEFALMQNYPNPFNPSTTIKFDLAKSSDVKLAVYTIDGREVAVLVSERREAGSYEVRVDGSNLSSGVYFYKIHAGDFVQTRKLVLLK
jgi:hypothetical protein